MIKMQCLTTTGVALLLGWGSEGYWNFPIAWFKRITLFASVSDNNWPVYAKIRYCNSLLSDVYSLTHTHPPLIPDFLSVCLCAFLFFQSLTIQSGHRSAVLGRTLSKHMLCSSRLSFYGHSNLSLFLMPQMAWGAHTSTHINSPTSGNAIIILSSLCREKQDEWNLPFCLCVLPAPSGYFMSFCYFSSAHSWLWHSFTLVSDSFCLKKEGKFSQLFSKFNDFIFL